MSPAGASLAQRVAALSAEKRQLLARRNPLSFAQERLWFLDRLHGPSAVYNGAFAVDLAGEVSMPALAAALSEIVRRHQVLRTCFLDADGVPLQLVAESARIDLPVVDLRGLPAALREPVLESLLAAHANRPFDLAAPPLVKALLAVTAEAASCLVLAVHHIACDRLSGAILLRELAALYAAALAGAPSPLPELPLQLADWAAWQRAEIRGQALERLLDAAKARLAGVPTELALPTDRPRPAVERFRGARVRGAWPASLVRAVRALAARRQATELMVLQAAFAALLFRLSGQAELLVGTSVDQRVRPELEGLIGLFINTLVLPARQAGSMTAAELVEQSRDTVLAALDLRDLPFELLVDAVETGRALSRNPLFQVEINAVPALAERLALGQAQGTLRPVDRSTAVYDLVLSFEARAESYDVTLELNRDLFDRTTGLRLLAQLERVTEGLVNKPEETIDALALLSPEALHQVRCEWAQGPLDAGRPEAWAHDLFARQATLRPHAEAASNGAQRITYRDLDRLANRWARCAGRGERVAVLGERGIDLLAVMLGLAKAGAAYVPLEPNHPDLRLAAILEDCAPALLIASPGMAERARSLARRVVVWDAPPEEEAPLPVLSGSDLACVFYTSGSTGRPKGAMIEHAGLVNHLWGKVELLGLGPGSVVAQNASQAFDISVWQMLAPLVVGGSVAIYSGEAVAEPESLLARVEADGVTVLETVPTLLDLMLAGASEAVRLPRLAYLISNAETLPVPLARRWAERFPHVPLVNTYGATECSDDVTHQVFRTPPQTARVGVGRPIARMEVYVLDAGLAPTPLGVPGQLAFGGQGVGRGYLDDPVKTAGSFVPHPFASSPGARIYLTGDLGRFAADGTVDFLGRIDHQVKVRGHRIELGEIEAALTAHPAVREAVAVVRRDEGEARLVGYVVGDLDLGDLRAFLRGRLPEPMLPAAFVVLDAFPLTPNGKVDRKALPAPAAEPSRATLPRGPVEELLAAIWSELLGREAVGCDEDFFALGGHSLLAARVVARARTAFGVELPLAALFTAPTVTGLAAAVEEAMGGGHVASAPILPAPRDGKLPLSFAQERLWFLHQLEPQSPAYNMPLVLRLDTDLATLAAAVSALSARHESLRTVFREGEQVILPAAAVPLPVIDLSRSPEREAELSAVLVAEARRPFDLERGPVFRALLVRLGNESILALSVHHIASDGWSMEVVRRELGLFCAGRWDELSPLAVQYADYAVWQRRELAGEALAAGIEWWRRHLEGAPPVLELPADRPRPAVRSDLGGVRRRRLPPGLSDAVLRLGRASGTTRFMTLLAGWSALAARLAHQPDLVIGTPVAGRDRLELEGVVGFFVNTLALRLGVDGEGSFADLLAATRETALGAYAHQHVPFERLVEELAPARSLAYTPLFQVLFAFEDAVLGAPAFGTEIELEAAAAKLDLILALREEEGCLAAAVTWSTDLFDTATVERWLGYLEALLTAATADPQARLASLPILSAAELTEILAATDRTAVAHRATCLHTLVEEQARRTPERVAIVSETASLTYREMDARAERLAGRLQGWGVGPETRVGIFLERTEHLPVALLAVLKAGGVYVPLDPAYPRERLAFTLEDAETLVILTQATLAPLLPATGCRVVCLGTDLDAAPGYPVAVTPDNLAYLIYTSGSTGRPKAVAIRHESAALLCLWARGEYGDDEIAAVLAATSICFDLSVFEIFVPLAWGGSVVMADNALALPAVSSAVTLVNTVPSAIAELVRTNGVPGSVRTVNLAGEPLARGLVEDLYRLPGVRRVANLYGPSEDTTYSTWTTVPDGAVPTIGRPVDGTHARALDPWGEVCPRGVAGELFLGGRGVARGYLGRPRLTAERFVPDPFSGLPGARLYRTGDLVRLRGDGDLEFLGRIDHQVKLRGFRIEPGEVEAALLSHPAVRDAVVVVRADEEAEDRRLVAYVVGEGLDAEPLRRFLGATLPDFMIPQHFVVLAELPLTPNGKVDRGALPKPRLDDRAAPRAKDAIEELVAAIWEDVLKLAPVGRDDNFFALGGHSLLATRVVSRLRESFGIDVPLRRLFEAPTVAALAASVAADLAGSAQARPPLLRRVPGEPPLSFAQHRLWFMDQLAPGGAEYNIAGAVRLAGPLDPNVLAACFGEIVRRHEVLRASFCEAGGQPAQRIAGHVPVALPFVDLSASLDRDEVARALCAEHARQPFSLSHGPLLRLLLVRLGAEEHVLALSLHHIVADAWSLQVLLRELAELYPAFAAGRPSPLPELPVQYGDFAAWQRQWLAGEVLASHLAWWRRSLAGSQPLALPADFPRGEQRRGRFLRRELPADLTADLKALSRREGTTLFMTLLAGFATVLGAASGEDDVVVGADIANRTLRQTEDLIGFFVNMLVLRTDLSKGPTFRQLLGRVRETTLGAYAHQELPLERLVEELQPERGTGHSPLFSVVFNFNNTGEADGLGPIGPLTLTPLDLGEVTVRFELALLMRETRGGLDALWLYDGALFREATVERLHRRLAAMLAAAAAEPETRLSHLDRPDREKTKGLREKLLSVRPEPVRVT